jgi:hypothetical protein
MGTTRPSGTHRPLVSVPADEVDTWLIEQYQLSVTQRWQVRDAVRYGREVPDPALRRAAYDLAGCTLRGEFRLGRGLRAAGVILVAEGAAVIVLGIIVAVVADGLAALVAVIPLLLGAVWLARGIAALRLAQQGPARARQLNA